MHAEDSTAEQWREVVGWPRYRVSSLGRVKSLPNPRRHSALILRPETTYDGYKRVVLCIGGVKRHVAVHLLVLEAFVSERPGKNWQASHLDGDAGNNRLENLRWETVSTNNARRYDHGTMPRGEASPQSKLTLKDVKEIRSADFSVRGTQARLARRFGVSPVAIRAVRLRQTWRHAP